MSKSELEAKQKRELANEELTKYQGLAKALRENSEKYTTKDFDSLMEFYDQKIDTLQKEIKALQHVALKIYFD